MLVTDPDAIVHDLVESTRALAKSGDPVALKSAFEAILRGLHPDDCGTGWRDGTDVLGSAYMGILPSSARRAMGQVFTPPWAARVMAGWALQEGSSSIMDPGCGSGVLLLAAHETGLAPGADYVAIDSDPLAVLMTKVNADLRGLTVDADCSDFLLDAVASRPSAVLCNPPYTRHHCLTHEQKERIAASIGQRLGLRHTRSASLHALFLARAVEVAAAGGRIAFLTPSQWLETGYGREIKEYVDSVAHVVAVIDLGPRFFPAAMTSAVITLIEKSTGRGGEPLRIEVGDRPPEPAEIVRLVSAPRAASAGRTPRRTDGQNRVRLGDIAGVHRGVATGHNKFFVLSENERLSRGLSGDCLESCIASPQLFGGLTLTDAALNGLPNDKPRWLLRAPVAPLSGPLAEYLRYGVSLGASNRYLARHRRPWHWIKHHDRSAILFTYLNNRMPRFVRNEAGAVPLNNWLVIEPKGGIDADELFAALSDDAILKSAFVNARHYGSGLWKLEPSELADLRVPWPHAQSEEAGTGSTTCPADDPTH